MIPQVSIGLPAYNSSSTLFLAIQSVLAQTFEDWELIVCDDCSTDNSLEIARSVKDRRIHIVQNSRNLGLSACLDRIVELAQAPLVARMDSDDLLHPERMRRQVDVFETYSDIEVVSTDAFVVDDDNRVLGGRRKGEIASTAAGILWNNGPIHASIMSKRTWCARFPYVHELHRGEDLELWARALPSTRHLHLAERLYFIRENPDVNVAKYCRTINSHAQVFRSFAGQDDVTYPLVAALLARSYFRIGAYRVAGALGMQSRIASRRVEQLAPEELAAAQAVVNRIVENTPVFEEPCYASR